MKVTLWQGEGSPWHEELDSRVPASGRLTSTDLIQSCPPEPCAGLLRLGKALDLPGQDRPLRPSRISQKTPWKSLPKAQNKTHNNSDPITNNSLAARWMLQEMRVYEGATCLSPGPGECQVQPTPFPTVSARSPGPLLTWPTPDLQGCRQVP